MRFALIVLACVLVTAAAHEHENYYGVDYYAPANYKYEYSVADPHTGDNKQQYEIRDGDFVKGAYSLVEPDGTVRVVEYTSHPHTGFNAVVKKLGHAVHPQPYPVHQVHAVPYPYHGGYGYGGYGYGGYGYGGHGAYGYPGYAYRR